jgi:molybdopterin-guanine dinucleotide biosynthesis protein A
MYELQEVSVVILAGGEGRRMGGRDKGLLPYRGRPLIEHVIQSLPRGHAGLLISANRNLEAYRRYAPVVVDEAPGHAGPLAGILAAMHTATTPYLMVLPCDTPHLPRNLLERLYRALVDDHADIAVACSGGRKHHVISLMKTDLGGDLRGFLASGERRVGLWHQRHRVSYVEFDAGSGEFDNINCPEALD